MPRHTPATPLTDQQRQLVEENYKLVFAGCKKYRRGDIDRELMEAEFAYALCQAALTYQSSKGSFSGWAFWYFYNSFMVLQFVQFFKSSVVTFLDQVTKQLVSQIRGVFPICRTNNVKHRCKVFPETDLLRWWSLGSAHAFYCSYQSLFPQQVFVTFKFTLCLE